jgi:hypothetical protein
MIRPFLKKLLLPNRKAQLLNSARRASLIGAPFVLLGAGKAAADTPFTNFAFRATGGNTSRTMPDRLADVYNVKDFGAVGNGSHDDRQNIQDAMDYAVARGGGIVFFPRGSYYVRSKLIPTGNNAIHLVGSGGSAQGSGSRIWTDQRDYVLYIPHGQTGGTGQTMNAIRSIRDLNFQNIYGGHNEANYLATTAATSTEPKATTGYTDNTPGPAGQEGHGCLYLGNIYRGNFTNVNVDFGTGIGIAVISGYAMEFTNCDIHGGFNPDSTNSAMFSNFYKSIGLWMRAGSFGNARIDNFGTAIVVTDGPVDLHMMDIENVGNGIICASKPLSAWNPELLSVRPPEDQVRFQMSTIRSIGIEKVTNIAYWIKAGGNASFLSCHCAGGGLGAVQGQYGVKIDGGANILFQGMDIGGYLGAFGFDLTGAVACTFRNCSTGAISGGGAVPWKQRTTWDITNIGSPSFQSYPNGVGSGNQFEFCDTDGAIGMLGLPSWASATGPEIWVTDCLYPAWTGSVSNVGKPVSGTATVNAPTAVNGTVMFFPTKTGFPSFLGTVDSSHQWYVAGTNNPFEVQIAWGVKVTAADPATGRVTVNQPLPLGVASGGVMFFIAAGGTNKVRVRWRTTTGVFGYWAIAG